MSNFDDENYYSRREKSEREIANRTTDPLLSGIHRQMADLYLARATQSAAIEPVVVEMSPGLA